METSKPIKPLGSKAYGSIPHLPGSRRGQADHGLSESQARILTDKARDKHDQIIVQEKLDGSCVSVAKINGEIIALIRAGYPASGSNYKQHHHFADWVKKHESRFVSLLSEGERCVGEWLMEAHGTRYGLIHEPFVLFDILQGQRRSNAATVKFRADDHEFITPVILNHGNELGAGGAPMSVEDAMKALGDYGFHGAIDFAEGAVWRCERKGEVDFLGKYVRPEKIDGRYLENISGKPPIFNWQP